MTRCIAVAIISALAVGATPRPGRADDYLDLPAGVTHIALPPGDIKIEYTVKDKKPLLRITAGQTVIVAQTVFFGDGKNAKQASAANDGIHWVDAMGRGDVITDGSITDRAGATHTFVGGYVPIDKLRPASVYLTTPSVKFNFQPAAKPKE